jgi:hypothetical protein
VDIRIIGTMPRKSVSLAVRKLNLRLHTRTIVRDGKAVFLGSQSLRELELDERREIGIIFREPKAVAEILRVFEEDWGAHTLAPGAEAADTPPVRKLAKKVARVIVEELPPVAPVLDEAVKELGVDANLAVDTGKVEDIVKDAIKEAVKEAVKEVVVGGAEEEPNVA